MSAIAPDICACIYNIHRSLDIYGWTTPDEATTFTNNIESLHISGLLMWPPATQILRAGLKDPDIALLDLIAADSQTLRPRTTTINVHGSVDDNLIITGTVLKRSNSDCSQHIIMPADRRRRNVEHLRACSLHGEKWLMQEYVNTLQTVGEWRTFIVNGSVIHSIHTYMDSVTNAWVASQATSFWSLEEIRYVWGYTGSQIIIDSIHSQIAPKPSRSPPHPFRIHSGQLGQPRRAGKCTQAVRDVCTQYMAVSCAKGEIACGGYALYSIVLQAGHWSDNG